MIHLLKLNLFILTKGSTQATTQTVNQKPQRTFLRKGQGLARFKGKSTINKTVGQPKGSASQATTVPQKKEKKTGNPVPSLSLGSDKLAVSSGVPVAQGKVNCIAQSFDNNNNNTLFVPSIASYKYMYL